MPSALTQSVLFASSFAPLLIVFALLQTFFHGWMNAILVAIAVVTVVCLSLFLRAARRLQRTTIVIESASQRDGDTVGYVVTYLLPFAALAVPSWQEKVALLLFVAIVAILYIRADLFYVNPILALAGYRLFDVDGEGGRPMIVLSKRRYLQRQTQIHLHSLSDYVFLEADGA